MDNLLEKVIEFVEEHPELDEDEMILAVQEKFGPQGLEALGELAILIAPADEKENDDGRDKE